MSTCEIARHQLYGIIERELSAIFGDFIGNGVTLNIEEVENQPEDLLVTVQLPNRKEIIFLIHSYENNSSIWVKQNDLLDRTYEPMSFNGSLCSIAQQHGEYMKQELRDTLNLIDLDQANKDFLGSLIN